MLRVLLVQPSQKVVTLPCFFRPSLTLILNQNQLNCSELLKTFFAQDTVNGRSADRFTHVACSYANLLKQYGRRFIVVGHQQSGRDAL